MQLHRANTNTTGGFFSDCFVCYPFFHFSRNFKCLCIQDKGTLKKAQGVKQTFFKKSETKLKLARKATAYKYITNWFSDYYKQNLARKSVNKHFFYPI